MRLEQFEYLIAVAEQHSMQKASDILHTSIQNVSKSIKQLERELDTVLFVRNSFGVYLTKDGELVYEQAKAIILHLNIIRNEYNLISQPEKDSKKDISLNILCSQYLANTLSKVHAQMIKNYNFIESNFYVKDAHNINYILESNDATADEFDIITTNVPAMEVTKYKNLRKNFLCYYLEESRIGIRISETHYLSAEKSISIKNLERLPLIQFTPDIDETSYIQHMIEGVGINIQPKYKVNSVTQGITYIKENLGYAFTILSSGKDEAVDTSWAGTTAIPLAEKLVATHILLINKRFMSFHQADVMLNKIKKTYPKLHRI